MGKSMVSYRCSLKSTYRYIYIYIYTSLSQNHVYHFIFSSRSVAPAASCTTLWCRSSKMPRPSQIHSLRDSREKPWHFGHENREKPWDSLWFMDLFRCLFLVIFDISKKHNYRRCLIVL